MKKGFLKHRGGRGRLGRVMESTPRMAEEEIRERLRGVRWRMRRAQAWRGAMVVATVALGGLVVMMGIDLAVSPLPGWLRWAMFVAWVAAVGWAMRAGFTPLLQKIGLVQVARWIEARHPEMQERMSTVLELSGGGGGGSAELLGVIGREAAADAGTVDAQGEVRAARTSPRWARPAGVLAAGLLAALVVWRRSVGVATARDMRRLSDRQRGLLAEKTTLERDIRSAMSRGRVIGEAARRLGLHVATDAQTRMLSDSMLVDSVSRDPASADSGSRS